MRPFAWFITPIAIPGRLIEAAYRRRRGRFWEFDMWSGSYYLAALILAGLAAVATNDPAGRILGLYVLSATELLALMTVAALPLGDRGGYVRSLAALSRRKRSYNGAFARGTGSPARPLWAALTAYLYTTIYFTVCARLLRDRAPLILSRPQRRPHRDALQLLLRDLRVDDDARLHTRNRPRLSRREGPIHDPVRDGACVPRPGVLRRRRDALKATS